MPGYTATPNGLPSIGFDAGDAYQSWWDLLQHAIDGAWLACIHRHGGSDVFDVRIVGTSIRSSDGYAGILVRRTDDEGDIIRPDLPPEFLASDEFDSITIY